MPAPDCVRDYLDSVLAHVRWKRAHAPIRRELSDHIADQCAVYEERNGMPPAQALECAVADMGDAALVGARLDGVYRPATPWGLVVPLLLLVMAEILLRFFFYLPQADGSIGGNLLAIAGGAALAALLLRADLYRLAGRGILFYGCCSLAILGLCVFRQLNLFALSAEQTTLWHYPALLLPVAYACLLYDLRGGGFARLLLAGAALAVPMLAVVFLPSAAMAFYLGVPCLTILVLAIADGVFRCNRAAALLVVFGALALGLFAILAYDPYRLYRTLASVIPNADPDGLGWTGMHIRDALYGARFIGGAADSAYRQLFSAGNSDDYFLAWLILRFGWISLPVCLLPMVLVTVRGFRLGARQNSQFGRLACLSIVAAYTIQWAGCTAANLGCFLLNQYAVPFLGQSKLSFLTNAILLSSLVSLLRTNGLFWDVRMDMARDKGPQSQAG